MSSWQIYNSNAFVDRPSIVKAIEEWVDNPASDRQVLSLIGPPGSGKSWVLHALHERWASSRLVLKLDIPLIINHSEKNIREKILNQDQLSKWFKNVYKTAADYCFQLSEFDTNITPGRAVDLLVAETCQNSDLTARPILLIDGYDYIDPIHSQVVCDLILAQFMGDQCWRLIIARREQQRLENYRLQFCADKEMQDTLWKELSIGQNNFALKQFRKFLSTYYPHIEIVDDAFIAWTKELRKYKWGHPFINAFLFETAMINSKGKLESLEKSDLENCLKSTLQRNYLNGQKASAHPLLPDDLKLLEQIACDLDETWTDHDVEEKLGVKYQEDSIKSIYDSGLIVEAGFKSRHKIADGIRQLLQEIRLH